MEQQAVAEEHSPEHIRLTPEAAAREIARRAMHLAVRNNRRVLIGLVGGPGSGKSTLASDVIGSLNGMIDGAAARVPMDSFHMMQAKLEADEMMPYKGVPQNEEAAKFAKLLKQLHDAKTDMKVPGYSRKREDVIADAFTIPANVPILVVEGNYILLQRPPWPEMRETLDFVFFIDVPAEIIKDRLIKRHDQQGVVKKGGGKAHVDEVDLINYEVVSKTAPSADLIIEIDSAS